MAAEEDRKMYRDPIIQGGLLAIFAAILGALTRWFQKNFQPFVWWVFALDMVISAGVGILVFWLVIDFEGHQSVAAACSALSGNLGSRVFDIAHRLVREKTGIKDIE